MKTCTVDDTRFMTLALELADEAKGTTCPNPSVGAVIVNKGRIVGKGATECCGGAHAEVVALRQARAHAKGATLYVTLEPCCHWGRTPPCTDALIDAGISRVVVAVKDPNNLVAGKGLARLRRHGITAETGLFHDRAALLNEDFFWAIGRKEPWITLKLAMTLDGRIADRSGASQWITTPESRAFVHDLRRRHSAIAVGAGTFRADDPSLTVRLAKDTKPARIVFSGKKPLVRDSQFVKTAQSVRSIVVMPGGAQAQRTRDGNGLEIWRTGVAEPIRSMQSFLRMAYEEGLNSILVEGGSRLGSFLLESQMVNRLYVFYGNKIVGGGIDGMHFKKALSLDKPLSLDEVSHRVFGSDLMITGIVSANGHRR